MYSGLLTDTLCFRTSNTTANTLKMASILTSYDLPIAELNRMLFDQKLDEFKFGTYIRNNVKMIQNQIAYLIISHDTLEQYKIESSKARSMIDELGHVKEFKVWIIFTEELHEDGTIDYSASLRSKTIPVNDVAQKYGGGGHLNASGVKKLSYEQIHEMLDIFVSRL